MTTHKLPSLEPFDTTMAGGRALHTRVLSVDSAYDEYGVPTPVSGDVIALLRDRES